MSAAAGERELLAAAAALLQQGDRIDHLSRGLTVVALAGLVAAGLLDAGGSVFAVALGLAALAGGIELYLAIRVGFDAALFCRLGREAATAVPDMAALDSILLRLRLLPAFRAGRPVEQRIAGAQRLFYRQGAALAVQTAFLLAGAAATVLS